MLDISCSPFVGFKRSGVFDSVKLSFCNQSVTQHNEFISSTSLPPSLSLRRLSTTSIVSRLITCVRLCEPVSR